MDKKKLQEMLENKVITQEAFDELTKEAEEAEKTEKAESTEQETTDEGKDETLDRLYQAKLDRGLAKERKEKAELKKQLEKLQKKVLTEEEIRQNELEQERAEFEKERKEFEMEKRKNYALKALKKASIDDSEESELLLEKLVSACEDNDEIDETITLLKAIFDKRDKKITDKFYSENGRTPRQSNSLNGGVNPWAKDQFNLSQQFQIEATNPELAAQLQAAAGIKI